MHSSTYRNGEMTYRLFGLRLGSAFPFRTPLASADGPPELRFICLEKSSSLLEEGSSRLIYASRSNGADGAPRAALYRQRDGYLIRYSGIADFLIEPHRIVGYPARPGLEPEVEHLLLGPILAFWLEQQERLVLHASAAVVEGRVVAFLAPNTGGKSSLLAALMQAGYPMLSDDVLPIREQGGVVMGEAAYPQMRLWPDQVARLAQGVRGVHPVLSGLRKCRVPVEEGGMGRFSAGSWPLAGLYLLKRRPPARAQRSVDITPLAPWEALRELLRHSFLAQLVGRAGLQPARLPLLAQVARRVPMCRIAYPDDVNALPAVREALLADLCRLRAA